MDPLSAKQVNTKLLEHSLQLHLWGHLSRFWQKKKSTTAESTTRKIQEQWGHLSRFRQKKKSVWVRQQLNHSNSRCGALVSLSISPSDDRDDDYGEDDQGESDKHPEKGKCFWSTSSKYHICQTSPCVDMTQWCTIFLLKRGCFIWNSKEEGSHYGSLLDKQWPTWRAEWQERKKTRPKNVGTAFAEIFGTDTMQSKTCCCLISQVATLI